MPDAHALSLCDTVLFSAMSFDSTLGSLVSSIRMPTQLSWLTLSEITAWPESRMNSPYWLPQVVLWLTT